jgi:hypothetical protein
MNNQDITVQNTGKVTIISDKCPDVQQREGGYIYLVKISENLYVFTDEIEDGWSYIRRILVDDSNAALCVLNTFLADNMLDFILSVVEFRNGMILVEGECKCEVSNE